MKTKNLSNRYNLIDVIRALSIISMVVYHLCYDIFIVYERDPAFDQYPLVILWERSICFSFIIVSGISLNFSRHAYRRGIIVNLCGFAVTAVTLIFLPSQQIWFGVLNLIGCAMFITQALRKLFDRIHPAVGMTLSMAAFALTYNVPFRYLGFFSIPFADLPPALYSCPCLAFLGFPAEGFYSADYFPLIPWLFLFIFGYFLWRYISLRGRDGFFRFNIPVLSFIGRHSLVIYMAHQLILYGICLLIFGAEP
ncbi:MAG: DUF1624 domain-containing protein [Ruminococcus sp.]|nr:DUF1624 domain-containing protein [Ruminococcus sp.]